VKVPSVVSWLLAVKLTTSVNTSSTAGYKPSSAVSRAAVSTSNPRTPLRTFWIVVLTSAGSKSTSSPIVTVLRRVPSARSDNGPLAATVSNGAAGSSPMVTLRLSTAEFRAVVTASSTSVNKPLTRLSTSAVIRVASCVFNTSVLGSRSLRS